MGGCIQFFALVGIEIDVLPNRTKPPKREPLVAGVVQHGSVTALDTVRR